ncbi:putative membrane protein [Neobacillus niacini]|uniref:hypothetical protein n=1 Tax=Neobacillus driksii TaxID=3035913 RepID=UPI00278B0230|nr:hypothetical protein [Neobacillus niacini]MDQ0976601.1 putative membrane protein [Neobacillus niacini]
MKKVLAKLKQKKVILAIVSGLLVILVSVGLVDGEMSAKISNVVDVLVGMLDMMDVIE